MIDLPRPSQYRDNEEHSDKALYEQLCSDPYYSEQLGKVFEYDDCELCPEFLGFTADYRHLSMIIPLHFTVIDFGCNHAVQSFYFKDHKAYIGVDAWIPIEHRVQTPNSQHYIIDGKDFISEMNKKGVEISWYPVFAISNFVPNEELNLLIRARFKDLHVFYPKSKMPDRPKKPINKQV